MQLDPADIEAVAERVAELLATPGSGVEAARRACRRGGGGAALGSEPRHCLRKGRGARGGQAGQREEGAAALRSEQAPGARLDQPVRDG